MGLCISEEYGGGGGASSTAPYPGVCVPTHKNAVNRLLSRSPGPPTAFCLLSQKHVSESEDRAAGAWSRGGE